MEKLLGRNGDREKKKNIEREAARLGTPEDRSKKRKLKRVSLRVPRKERGAIVIAVNKGREETIRGASPPRTFKGGANFKKRSNGGRRSLRYGIQMRRENRRVGEMSERTAKMAIGSKKGGGPGEEKERQYSNLLI